MYKIFVVEDHPIMRQSFVALLENEQDFEVCGAVASAEEALEQILQSLPDIVLIDVSLKGMNGIELVKQLRVQNPQILTLIVSGHDESVYAEAAFEAGARGYVMKRYAYEVIPAMRLVLQGDMYMSERMRRRLEHGKPDY